jgi:hypothetical protein
MNEKNAECVWVAVIISLVIAGVIMNYTTFNRTTPTQSTNERTFFEVTGFPEAQENPISTKINQTAYTSHGNYSTNFKNKYEGLIL